MISASKNDLSQMVATLTDDYRVAAMKYIEFLLQSQKTNAKATLSKIQNIFSEALYFSLSRDLPRERHESFSKNLDN